MLVEYGEQEREAECRRCHRRSPVLHGDENPARDRLEALGWVEDSNGGWCCPICRSRLSGEYRATNR